MDGLQFEYGARFIVGAPHPMASPEATAHAALQEPEVRRALSSRTRLLHIEPLYEFDAASDRSYTAASEAVLYDYSHNRTVRVRAGGGAQTSVVYSDEQPVPSQEEFEAAVALVARSPVWGPLLQSGNVRPYRPMPPMLEAPPGEAVERTVFVGLASKPRRFNQIAAVNMVRGEVAAQPVVPRSSRATVGTCGLSTGNCRHTLRGATGFTTIEWPTQNPVWKFQVIRPSASTGANASGIELHNVYYQGTRVFKQAHMPILNVQYDDNVCGPYRDWLWEETCFQADGKDIPGAPGIRWCDTPPSTILESREDVGNYNGVAAWQTEDGALGLTSQMAAGWYRYILAWYFYPDGRIHPRIRFGSTENSCVCFIHNHHAYWRLDFDIVQPANSVEQFNGSAWAPIDRETSVQRVDGQELRWRVSHPKTGAAYEIIPGAGDGVGDAFSGDDQFALKYRPKEIDDRGRTISFAAQADLKQFVTGEKLAKTDVVIWYAAHFRHNINEEGQGNEVDVGPILQPSNWPAPKKL